MVNRGKRQGQIVAALVGNFDAVEESLKTAENSMGSAAAEFERAQDSIAFKSNQLSQTMTMFWQNFIDREVIKDLIDGLTKIAEILNFLVSNPVPAFVIQVGILSTALILLSQLLTSLGVKFIGFVTGIAAADVAALGFAGTVKALTATLMANPLFWPVAIIAGIYALVKAIDYASDSIEDQKKKVEELTTELSSLQSQYSQLYSKDARTESEEIYLRLLEKEIELKEKDLEIERERYLQRKYYGEQDSSSGWNGGIVGGIDLPSSGIDKANNDLQKLQDKYKELLNTTKDTEAFRDLEEEINILRQSLNDTAMDIMNNTDSMEELERSFPELASFIKGLGDLEGLMDKLGDKTDDQTNEIFDLATAQQQLLKDTSDYISSVEDLSSAYNSLNEGQELSAKQIIELTQKYPELIQYLEVENGQLHLNKQGVEILLEAKHKAWKDELQIQKQKLVAEKEILESTLNSIRSQIQAYGNLNTAIAKTLAIQRTYLRMQRTGELAHYSDFSNYYNSIEQLADINAQIANIDKLLSLNIGGITGIATGGTTGGSSSSPTDQKEYISKLEQYYNQLRLITQKEEELSRLQKERNLLYKDSDILESIQQEIILQRELEALYKNLNQIQTDSLQKLAEEINEFSVANVSDDLRTLTIDTAKYNNLSDEQKEKLDELINSFDDLTKSINSSSDAILDAQNALQDLTEQSADEIIDIYKRAYTQQRDMAVNAINEELRALEETHNKKIQYLNDELSAYEDIINEQLKLIDQEEDQEAWDKKLAKAQEERAELLRQKNLLAMDDSLEGRARLSEVNEQLNEVDERIEEMRTDRTRQLRRDNLNEQMDNFREETEAKIEAENDQYEVLKLALEQEREEIQYHYDELLANEQLFADLREDIIEGNLENIQEKLADFLSEFQNTNEDTIRELGMSWQELLNLIGAVESAQSNLDVIKSGTSENIDVSPPAGSGSGGSGSSGSSDKNNTITYKVKSGDTLSGIASKYPGISWPEIYNANKQMIDAENRRRGIAISKKWLYPGQVLKIPSHHAGGIVGNINSQLASDLFSMFSKDLKPNEIYAKLLKNEVVLNPNIAMPQLSKNIASMLKDNTAGKGGNTYVTVYANIDKLMGGKQGAKEFYDHLDKELIKRGVKI